MADTRTAWMVCNSPGDASHRSHGIWAVARFDENGHPCLGDFPLLFATEAEAAAVAAYCASTPQAEEVKFRTVKVPANCARVFGVCDGEKLLRDPSTRGVCLPELAGRLERMSLPANQDWEALNGCFRGPAHPPP